jgi:hypothetical protein
MITSWKDFFIAVEQMRHCQRTYFLSKTLTHLTAAKDCEAIVDACIKEKRAQWEGQQQPALKECTHE